MFGINKLIVKLALIVVTGIVVICALNGCALSEKTEKHNDSVNVSTSAYVDPLELMEAKAEAQVSAIRAKEEKWRLAVWIFGIGVVIVGVLALLIRSPFDWKKGN